MFAVKHSPFDMIPQVIKRGEDDTKRPASVMRKEPRHVFKKKIQRPLLFNHSGQFKEESASCIFKSFSPASCRKRLAGESPAQEVEVGGVLWGQWFLRRDSRLPPFRARGWRDSWRLHICRFRNDRYTEIRLPSLTLPGNRRRPRTYQNIGLYVQLSSPSSCSARKKPRTSSSTLPAGCGREIVCG